jgi:Tol biopolymer transport system component
MRGRHALGASGVPLVFAFGCRWNFDAQLDAASVDAGWSTPIALDGANSLADEEDCTGSSSKTEIIFSTLAPYELFTVERGADGDPWGPPQPFQLNTANTEATPRLSFDERTLYFESDLTGDYEILATTRTARGQPWSAAQPVVDVSSAMQEKWFSPCSGDRYVVARSPTFDGGDIYAGTLGAGPPTPVAELNTPATETSLFITEDCLTLYFASDRNGTYDVFRTQRASISQPWDAPVVIPELADPAVNEQDPWVSPDERLLLFASDRAGTYDVYMSTR